MILEADNIELSYGDKTILQAIYLKAESKKITGIFGRNGSGKSSLLQIIFGTVKPKYKLIRINGKPIDKKFYKTGFVAYLPQHHYLPSHISLKEVFQVYGISWEEFASIFEEFLIYKNHKSKELSGGEQRIIEIYLVLKSKAKVILLDEPFSNIAPLHIEKIKALIQQEKEEKIIILTDHFYRDVLTIADDFYLIQHKRSIKISHAKELKKYGYLSS